MKNIMTLANTQAMTSVEVVEIINQLRPETASVLTHDNFMKRCVRVANELGGVSIDGTYIDAQGKPRPCYLLDKEMCLILVASESAKVMQAIIRRWQELEAKQQQSLPQSRIEAVRAYLETLEQLELVEQLAAEQAATVSQQSGLLVQQKEVIDYKKIITGEGEEYFPISLILEHNEDRTFSGRRLTIFSAKAEIDPIPMFASKGQIPVKAYHWSVWEAAYPNVILPE